ncbi:MAG: hypothetical protein V7K27_19045 [Nostoc sp.]|uniref:DUF7660 family protein n=1 Tax=Nostoc sp. TaxID=1180 RepID=UPI002FF44038
MKKIFTGDELVEYAKTISSKEEFEHFLKCLLQDYKENQNDWENADLSRYRTEFRSQESEFRMNSVRLADE